jgi:hypothetical protein
MFGLATSTRIHLNIVRTIALIGQRQSRDIPASWPIIGDEITRLARLIGALRAWVATMVGLMQDAS